MRTPAWLQRLEARIALALSRADAGVIAQAAGANHGVFTNAAPIAPAVAPIFQSPAFTSRTGHVRVFLNFTVNANGGTAVVGDTLELTPIRDGAPAAGLDALSNFSNTHQLTTGGVIMTTFFEDTVTPGTAHTWGGQVTNTLGDTQGASAANLWGVMIQDLPG